MLTDTNERVPRASWLAAWAAVLFETTFLIAGACWLVWLAHEVVGPTQRQLPDVGKVFAYVMAAAFVLLGVYGGVRSGRALLRSRPFTATLQSVRQPSERFAPASVAYAIRRDADGRTLPATRLQRFGLRPPDATKVVVWCNATGTWVVVVGSRAVWLPSGRRSR